MKESSHTYIPNNSLEDPHIDEDGVVNYFNSVLSDLCPFLVNAKVRIPLVPNPNTVGLSGNMPLSYVLGFIRWTIPFSFTKSEMFGKSAQELVAYEMPITKIIEENSFKDLMEMMDDQIIKDLNNSGR